MVCGSPQRRASASSSAASTRLVVPIETSKPFSGPATPRRGAWIVEWKQPNGLADLAQLLDAPLGASGLDAHTGAVEPKPDEVDLVER